MAHDVEVLIVGAGPAGGHLARLLARRGVGVLLADRLKDLAHNPFSSAGMPFEALRRFDIPEACVGAAWRSLELITSGERGRWDGEAGGPPAGVVLDFAKLRNHLAREVREAGGDVWLGARALRRDGATVRFQREGQEVSVTARTVVDATGPARALMRQATPPGTAYLSGTGLELLVEVPPEVYARYRDTLVFFMGQRWMPKGYSWIFPMEPNRLKVGAGRFLLGEAEPGPSLRERADQVLRDELRCPEAKVVDVHGAALKYARGMSDVFADGPALAIGDAVSTLNVLGGEGIRHAMEGAELALPFVLRRLQDPGADLSGYRRAVHRRFQRAWAWSEELAIRKYLQDDDARIDALVRFLKPRKLEFLVDVLFNYNFGRAARAAGPAYLWRVLKRRMGVML